MFSYHTIFQEQLTQLKQDGAYRYFLNVNKSSRHFPVFYFDDHGKSKKAINFCSNDYLGMSVEEEVIGKQSFVLHQTGTGSGGTRNISGSTPYHMYLEQTLAKWHQKDAALLFGSAYLANFTTLQTLGRRIPDLVFVSDERNHASLIEGMRSVNNKKIVFRHNDTKHLEEILQSIPSSLPKIVVFESVYSMNGQIAPVKKIIELSKKYHALIYIDEVHAIGLYGHTGGGICEQEGLLQEVDIINGTLAKAIGVIGGYITSSQTIIDFIRCFGSGFIFTTSLPPAICAAAEKSIQIIQKHSNYRNHVFGYVGYLRRLLIEAEINFTDNLSHITPVIIGDPQKCREVANTLLHQFGIYVQPVNFPTVPKGEECLRIIVTAKHNRAQVLHLVNSLKIALNETYQNHLQAQQA